MFQSLEHQTVALGWAHNGKLAFKINNMSPLHENLDVSFWFIQKMTVTQAFNYSKQNL